MPEPLKDITTANIDSVSFMKLHKWCWALIQAHVDYPKGDPENPATKTEIISKFHSLTGRYLDKEKREKIINTVNRLDEIVNIAELADLIR
jgi:2-methylcitrate dehydratase PrpD